MNMLLHCRRNNIHKPKKRMLVYKLFNVDLFDF